MFEMEEVYPGLGRLMRSTMERAQPAVWTHTESLVLAETAGFEPARECYPPNRLAGGCFRPLSHVSGKDSTEGLNR